MPEQPSSIGSLLLAADAQTREAAIRSLSPEQALALLYDWRGTWARYDQLAPVGDWFVWLLMAGRGFGKTRSGAEWTNEQAKDHGRLILIGATAADARDVMIEGESGILAVSPPWFYPKYEPSRRRLTWPNGAQAIVFSAEEPERLRGPQGERAWGDEFAAWKFPQEAYDNLSFGMRLGSDPRICLTTTPKRHKAMRAVLEEVGTVVTTASTYANRDNLAPAFFRRVIARYEGTRLGRQEIHAEMLEEVEGALWSLDLIESLRVRHAPRRLKRPLREGQVAEPEDYENDFVRIVIGVDPAVSAKEDSDETGIVVDAKGPDGHGYTLEDLSGIYTPNEWADVVVRAYERWNADRIVGEVNNGGDLVEANVRAHPRGKAVAYKAVHAHQGKRARAEPISALYEQGRWHHVGLFAHLEDQMTGFTPDGYEGSPDRVDAHVWAATELAIEPGEDVPSDLALPGGLTGSSKWGRDRL